MKAVKKEWQLQEVKNRFSEVVNLALADGPQTITRRGKPVAVMISVEEFRRLAPETQVKDDKEWNLLEHLLACPDKTLHKRVFRTPGPPRDVDLS